MKRISLIAGSLVAALVVALGAIKLRYGGGQAFVEPFPPFRVTNVEVAATLDFPPGCVTVSPEGRVFFDTHPFSAPGRFGAAHVFEWVDGKVTPWPSAERQDLFIAPFGLTADRQGRLWFIEPAALDRSATRILAFDLDSDRLIFDHTLPAGEARFAQDLRVSPDGRLLVLADTGAFRFTPGQLVVFDIEKKRIVRTFRHHSLNPQNWFIRRMDGKPHRIGWGLLTFQVGVDGITFGDDGAWLYYATMSHDTLYRLPSRLLFDPETTQEALAASVVTVGKKPQSDGIAATTDGRILITAIEHGGIAEMSADGALRTLTASRDVVWADSVEVAPDGVVWFTDSAIPAYLQPTMLPPSKEVLEAAGPYHIYRFRLPAEGSFRPKPDGPAMR